MLATDVQTKIAEHVTFTTCKRHQSRWIGSDWICPTGDPNNCKACKQARRVAGADYCLTCGDNIRLFGCDKCATCARAVGAYDTALGEYTEDFDELDFSFYGGV